MRTVVLSLGGSLMVPKEIDTGFLKSFRKLALDFAKDNRLVIVCGGGAICRTYNKGAEAITDVKAEDLDWLGIAATRLNAELMRVVLSDDAHPEVIKDPTQKIETDKNIIIGSGYKPGYSSDMDAVMLAQQFEAEYVINMTNVDRVYDSDPRENKDPRPIDAIGWDDFLKITGEEWVPGKNVPFDPVASKLARDNGIKVIILGKDLENLTSFLDGKEFVGTTIG